MKKSTDIGSSLTNPYEENALVIGKVIESINKNTPITLD